MNQQQTMLNDMVNGLFAELGHGATVEAAWPQVEALALPSLLVEEDAGGFGGRWDDALIVFRLAGYHALSAPVVEAILASHVAAPLGFEGRGTIAMAVDGTVVGGVFSGVVTGAVAAEGAAYVVAPDAAGGCTVIDLSGARVSPGGTLSDEARDVLHITGAKAAVADTDIFALGAFARAAQIAGALDAALEITVGYVNERKQFGKPLAKFQAVQQNLATFACEAAAANCAAIGAAQALDRGKSLFEIASAKLRCNRAVGIGASIAHQAHGAIGFTHEYALHPLTRRLWSWRSEFGGDRLWASKLGAAVLERGADNFWPDMTALTD